jgi:acetolactate synthase-1/2/3 large subunit
MKVSDYIAKFIESRGVRDIFELSGGMITHLLDSFSQKTNVNIYTVHHEQAASFAADAYGRVTGIPGVALATSGPGATNLLTGIGSCYFDSSPAIFITGQVNVSEQKGRRKIRQLGFQETDIVSMSRPVTKKVYSIRTPDEVPRVLEEAFEIAVKGRPGPVLIDIPMNVQSAQIKSAFKISESREPKIEYDHSKSIKRLLTAIQSAERPLLLVGRGIRASFSDQQLNKFIEITKLPTVTSLLGIDSLPYNSKYRVGFIGSYGNRWANMLVGESDLLIVMGSRLDIRQTGADTKYFQNRKIFHIDCEKAEINNRITGCVPVVADLRDFLNQFLAYSKLTLFKENQIWLKHINDLKEKYPDDKELNTEGINPNEFVHKLSKASIGAIAFLSDVGAHQMWVAQSIEITMGQHFITSGGMGAMGFALPAAIGATIALGKRPVVALIGDGSMQINLQELQTIVRNKLPVKIIVLNNQSLGMITQFQQSYFDSRYQSTYWGYSAPDFAKIATAYGIKSKTINNKSQCDNALRWLWNSENVSQPVLLQVMIQPLTNVYPKIAFGRPIIEMEPFAKPIEMEGT